MKISMNRALIGSTVAVGVMLFGLVVAPASAGSYAKQDKMAKMDIVDTAVSAGSFDTLVTAIEAAGLVETLKGKGPFTVFAPTDQAFAKIPADQLNALLADKEALTKVLTYHVVPGKVMAKDVVKMNMAKTVQGQSITIATKSGVTVDNANVIKTDIVTSNGVIHVIDTVILPDMMKEAKNEHSYDDMMPNSRTHSRMMSITNWH